MRNVKNNIDPKKFYSLGEIVRGELIPNIDTIAKASRLIRNDSINKVLRGQIMHVGRGIQYKVRGSNIISYLAKLDNE